MAFSIYLNRRVFVMPGGTFADVVAQCVDVFRPNIVQKHACEPF